MQAKKIFHRISYLQYPLMAISVYYYVLFFISLIKDKTNWEELNSFLIFVGIAISFSTLQDTKKTQNKFSKKIWESPKNGRIILLILSLMAFFLIIFGLSILYYSNNVILKNIAFGIIVLGIGLVGMLKSAIEMFENHRKDKNTTANNVYN